MFGCDEHYIYMLNMWCGLYYMIDCIVFCFCSALFCFCFCSILCLFICLLLVCLLVCLFLVCLFSPSFLILSKVFCVGLCLDFVPYVGRKRSWVGSESYISIGQVPAFLIENVLKQIVREILWSQPTYTSLHNACF